MPKEECRAVSQLDSASERAESTIYCRVMVLERHRALLERLDFSMSIIISGYDVKTGNCLVSTNLSIYILDVAIGEIKGDTIRRKIWEKGNICRRTVQMRLSQELRGPERRRAGNAGSLVQIATTTTPVATHRRDSDPWIGFIIEFPCGPVDTLENSGYGVIHAYNATLGSVLPSTTRQVIVKLPRHGYDFVVDPVSGAVREQLPEGANIRSMVEVKLHQGASVKVEGFGMPFSSPFNPCEAWVNSQSPIARDQTLLDMQSMDSHRLPPAFVLPYGDNFDLTKEDFANVINGNRGRQFTAKYTFETEEANLSALVHSDEFNHWKLDNARAAFLEEAEAMHRADLCSIRGN
ncbi:hypothetical protein CDD80_3365 [Ophiocordyceps camponoti-rufipedis]|uniref:Uncharacterized protein n=1 Tax=Ophiocordyceps camponoti-rufipedis TaxID=2004952 RepID=A0A2C5ZML6_9HYPO|nr:hypothetical protein CDD80_3365 [Ophiocordyceps camponoti-rufipedis]